MSDPLGELSEDSRVCRDLSHHWTPLTAWRTIEGFVRLVTCKTCGTLRRDHLNPLGQVNGRSYEYPEGYLLPPGEKFNSGLRDRLRLQSVEGLSVRGTPPQIGDAPPE